METFSALLAICAGTQSFDISLICVWLNGWVNNREAGDLRRYHAPYDVSVMIYPYLRFCNHVWGNMFAFYKDSFWDRRKLPELFTVLDQELTQSHYLKVQTFWIFSK